ncbi:hypothetical protein NDU88_004453 [Pleurodeles waltl]|uniref:Uncharacterized protein n=1 Tax=Pleurodeles waltl TaxID=8319 RepID=A0AAV7VH64_PLEWA|nr:hypothetical protein NDU88_004453 [Pleurodeles waltl]
MPNTIQYNGSPLAQECGLRQGEPMRAELFAAIEGTRMALDVTIEMLTVDVNLLWEDLRKVADKVNAEEESIIEL